MNNRGILTVVSGFSGSGKGTLMNELVKRYDEYALSISCTTRYPREGEVEGREYFFKTKSEFLEMIEKNALIEYAKYVNHYYGTPKAFVEDQLENGKDVILEIEVQGAVKIKEQFPEALLLFIAPPTAQELHRRLKGRGTEADEVIQERLDRALDESEGIESYDYLLINDDLEECLHQMHNIIQNEHQKVTRNKRLIKQIREDLNILVKGE